MYTLAYYVVHFVFSLFGRLKVFDKEKLPEEEGYILACTHTGWVDILWLGIAIYPTPIHFMAKKELFENGFVRWLISTLNAFPVDRENPGPSSIKIPRKLLKEDKVVGIFPSGTRTTEDVPLKRGAATIALHAKAPIVPAAYIGPNNFKEIFQRKKPRIIFGDPLYIDPSLSRREAQEDLANRLDHALKQLQLELEEKITKSK